jgi:hypothetical protein
MERTLILPSHWLGLLAAGLGLARVSPEARLAVEMGCKSGLAAKVTRFQHRSSVEIVSKIFISRQYPMLTIIGRGEGGRIGGEKR